MPPAEPDTDELLRFAVVDDEDLKIMSAHLQDASLRLDDIAFLKGSRRFAAVVARIDWRAVTTGKPQRRAAGFHFERVLRVQRSGFDVPSKDALQLLAISFRPGDAPSGDVVLTFAGGRMIKLDVECLEAEMRDLGPGWPVEDCPKHSLDGTETDR